MEDQASVIPINEKAAQPVEPWNQDPWILGSQPAAEGPLWPTDQTGILNQPAEGMRWETPPEHTARLLRAMMNPDFASTHPGMGPDIPGIQVPEGYKSPWMPNSSSSPTAYRPAA